ncbi:MAG: hypothetical protein KAX81_06035 [Leadbetterella sp.]|nr:hypothetical protein [Leadbetterella sp.]
MKTLVIKLLVLGLYLISSDTFGQITPKSTAEKFFKEYQNLGVTKSIDNLYASNKWMEFSAEAVSGLKTQLDALTLDFVGKFHGYELIKEQKIGENYIFLTYLGRYDRQPIRFDFEFYKPNTTWQIHSFSFDDKFGEDLK